MSDEDIQLPPVSALPWSEGTWSVPPAAEQEHGGELHVTATSGSDFWQDTYYGFHRDTGHALLYPFAPGQAIEVRFRADYERLYDQAGLLVRRHEQEWLKCGVEISDGQPQLGAVATRGQSDWSCGPVPEWAGALVTVRVSWLRDALLVRARAGREPWRTVRLAPFTAAGEPISAGPYLASPEGGGLTVGFASLGTGPADPALHLEGPTRGR